MTLTEGTEETILLVSLYFFGKIGGGVKAPSPQSPGSAGPESGSSGKQSLTVPEHARQSILHTDAGRSELPELMGVVEGVANGKSET